MWLFVWVSDPVCTTAKFNFITPAYWYTEWLSILSLSNVNGSTFLYGLLPTVQSHDWNEESDLEPMVGEEIDIPLDFSKAFDNMASFWIEILWN